MSKTAPSHDNSADNWNLLDAGEVLRLLQYLDVLAIALNRFRQCSHWLPMYAPTYEEAVSESQAINFDTPAWQAGVARLRDEFSTIRRALFPPHQFPSPAHHAAALRDGAISELARRRERGEELIAAINDAAHWLTAAGTLWHVRPTPRPWACHLPAVKDDHKRFDDEGDTLALYFEVRSRLLHLLVRTGITIPVEIRARESLAHDPWTTDPPPVTQEELLAMIEQAGDKSTGGAQGKKRGRQKKADAATEKREAEIASEWKQAKDAGVTKGEWFRDHKVKPGYPQTLTDLDNLLGRVRRR